MKMNILFFCILCWGLFEVESYTQYNGHKVIRITPTDEGQAGKVQSFIEKNQLDLWKESGISGSGVDVRVSAREWERLSVLLHKTDTPYRVMIEDIQRLLDRSFPDDRTHNTSRYYNLTEIHSYLDTMKELCGEECFTQLIGRSYEGRDLKIIKIGTQGAAPRSSIWIDCGIHAREWISPATCQYIIDRLINDTDNTTTALRDAFVWYIHPVVNVDGYDYTWTDDRMWRKTRQPIEGSACIGIDGNRNFDRGFGGVGSSDQPCSQTYKGPAAFSEPETGALDNYLRPMGSDFVLALTIHSYGQYFVYPWGYTLDEDPVNIADMVVSFIGCFGATTKTSEGAPADVVSLNQELAQVAQVGEDAINAVHGTGYIGRRSNGDMAGNTIDWAHGSCGIPYAYLFEIRDDGEYGFLLPPEFILPTGEEIWAGVQAMALEIASIEGIPV